MRRYMLERGGALITDTEWDKITQALELGICDICNARVGAFGRKGLHIDHDHTTNKLRGILCPECNTRLAWYEALTEEARSRLDKYLSH
mgnify:CR=1 FL=1